MSFCGEMIIFAFSCWDMLISSFSGLLTFICCGFTRTKVMVLCFFAWIAHFESYIFLCYVLPVVNGHPVVLSVERDKLLR